MTMSEILMAINGLSGDDAAAVACMAIDIAAKKRGETPPETLAMIAPMIKEVYETMGGL